MNILKLWVSENERGKHFMYPNGKLVTAEEIEVDYPAIAVFPHVYGTNEDGQMFASIDNLSQLRTNYNIDATLTNEEAVQVIQEIQNKPPEENTEIPTAESLERIAAALEFQGLLAL